jgi:hypothetical protein
MQLVSDAACCPCVCTQDDLGMCHWERRGSAPDGPRCLGSALDPTPSMKSRMHPGATGDGPTVSPAKSQAVFKGGLLFGCSRSRLGGKTSRHLHDHKPAVDLAIDVGACDVRRTGSFFPLFGGVKEGHAQSHARWPDAKKKIKRPLCLCPAHPMQWESKPSRKRRGPGRPVAEKDPLPRMRLPLSRFGGGGREVWEVWTGGRNWRRRAEGGLGLVEPDSPIPRFQLFLSFFRRPLWSSRFPTCAVALILPVAFRHRLARTRLLTRGSWLRGPFVFSCQLPRH